MVTGTGRFISPLSLHKACQYAESAADPMAMRFPDNYAPNVGIFRQPTVAKPTGISSHLLRKPY